MLHRTEGTQLIVAVVISSFLLILQHINRFIETNEPKKGENE